MRKGVFFLLVMLSFSLFSSVNREVRSNTRKQTVITKKSEDIEDSDNEEDETEKQYYYVEHIKKMIIDIQINKDGTLLINEHINYYTYSSKHGIFRFIPIKRDYIAGNSIGVVMNYIGRDGNTEKYKKMNCNDGIEYIIGNPKTYISKDNEYDINYIVYGAVEKKDNNIYIINWNAVGQYWAFPILDSEVKIHFEGGQKINANEVKNLEIFTGSYGSKNKDFSYKINEDSIIIKQSKVFDKNEGLSFFLTLNTEKINMECYLKYRT